MSETRDKRRRTDLDLFVLALIDSGVPTPYELQKAAGLSQGATTPALQRLLDARLVRQGKPGVRGRTDYQTTAAGRKFLKDGWITQEGLLSADHERFVLPDAGKLLHRYRHSLSQFPEPV